MLAVWYNVHKRSPFLKRMLTLTLYFFPEIKSGFFIYAVFQAFRKVSRILFISIVAILENIVFSFVLLVIYFHPIPTAFYFLRDSDIEINFLTLGQSGIYSYTYIRI